MGILNKVGTSLRSRIIKSATKTPKTIESVSSDLPKRGIIGQIVKSVEKIHKNQEEAFQEMGKQTPAPKYEPKIELSEEEIDQKIKQLEQESYSFYYRL